MVQEVYPESRAGLDLDVSAIVLGWHGTRKGKPSRGRHKFFFGRGGIIEKYESVGDPLMQFGSLVDWLVTAVPGVDRKAVLTRFRFSVRHGGFGRHGPRYTIEHLVDLDDIDAPLGMYSLRPSGLRAEHAPQLMRARASVWSAWVKNQDWPAPGEFDGTMKAISEPQPAVPEPTLDRAIYRSGAPGRPTSTALVEHEMSRRAKAGLLSDKLENEAKHLAEWLCKSHPDAPRMGKRAICNQLRATFRRLKTPETRRPE